MFDKDNSGTVSREEMIDFMGHFLNEKDET
jgi:Ca2+-binding EF-hand superfamily protein